MSVPISEQHARQAGEWRNIWYRTWPTKRDYSFTFTLVGGTWRIYINDSPGYGSRPSGSVATHRLNISGRPYICWDQGIETLSAAQAVAALWADSTEHYIATGRFELPPGRPAATDKSVLNGYPATGTTTARPAAAPRPPTSAQPSSLWSRIRDQLFNN